MRNKRIRAAAKALPVQQSARKSTVEELLPDAAVILNRMAELYSIAKDSEENN